MNFQTYLKDRWKTVCLLIFSVMTIEILLLLYPVHVLIRVYIAVIMAVAFLTGIFLEYRGKRKFYDELLSNLDSLKEKYMIVEMLKPAESFEEKLLTEILQESNKSMLEKVNEYRRIQQEYQEYIELWIHEVKLPIATAKLIIENNPGEVTESIEEELTEIEAYTEQALYYARSSQVNRDYCVTECSLRDIVGEAVKRNKKNLIRQRVRIGMEDLDVTVCTDSKWCQFILGQIIDNSIKYRRESDPEIRFLGEEKKDQVLLRIKDNGIGIKKSEVGRVFDKGFTGSNGRSGRKSTGIGLYLCRKLCKRLGIGIDLFAGEEGGCEVILEFPRNSFTFGDK